MNDKKNDGKLVCPVVESEDVKKEKQEFELSKTAEEERDILKFWEEHNIFKKSIDQREGKKEFVFYDGPPFATGLPHYGHLLPGTIKDVIPRYKTMQGFKVKRNWGWDCHGLPIENLIEKELGLNSKKEIEEYGIDKFNQKARDSVLRYDQDWKEIIPKTGRWVDMENPYKTMDASYTESLWWAFSELHKKGLVEKNFKPMHICPRCETTLSNNEVTDGYQDIKDLSLTAKFKLAEEENTYLLAWTTTPWTLPGNVALAVGKDIEYVEILDVENKLKYILASERLEDVFKNLEYEVVKEFRGEELIGKSYEPLFDYYSNNKDLENRENGWKVYGADFVDTETGTGIVHIAPAFGGDDLVLAQKYDLPFIQHVKMNGEFKKEVTDFAGMKVRKKDFHEESDIEIIKYLAHNGKLFSKKKLEHSYPHCWRCKTPLLNYATSSWFINSPKIKKELLKENGKINWVPKHIGEKRFQNWLENTKPWAVSRSRYWGAPLPIWENETTGEYEFIGSLEELKSKTKSTNTFTFLRHGESESNVKGIISSTIGMYGDKLTLEGKKQVEKAKQDLEEIDLIFSSPFERTKQTAELISKEVIFDDRLKEVSAGNRNGKLWKDANFDDFDESYLDVKRRVMDFIYEIDKKYKNKNILIVSHGIVGAILREVEDSDENVKNATVYKINFAPVPHNENYELDFHRPYIDNIFWENEKGEKYRYIKEVFDCWFESGSMPFASQHYPFDSSSFNPKKNIGFPADFIAEGVDQTRGWFNTMLILSTALFGKSAYQNVVVNGTILAEDGKKMSKSLKNYPPIEKVLNKYGADAMRLYILSSPAVRAEALFFSEKGVDEIMKKVIMKSKNILAFYKLYENDKKNEVRIKDSPNILDKWITTRTSDFVMNLTKNIENYELDVATRPIVDFIDDFSTWYIRRSRDRFKGQDQEDKDFALTTTREVLKIMAKVLAPFTPFLAEELWQELRGENDKESVHLENWPKIKEGLVEKITSSNKDLLSRMSLAREVVSLGMEQRAVSKIKVRQPLASIKVKGEISILEKEKQIIEIIKDELNIKEIVFDNSGKELEVELETELNDELRKEGNFREFLRLVQTLRKKEGLQVKDSIELKIDIDESQKDFIIDNMEELKNTAGVKNINYSTIDSEKEEDINGIKLKLVLVK